MCDSNDLRHGHGDLDEVQAAAPREIEGEAVDPIVLEPVDEVTITTLVDNSYDGLMVDMGPARRVPMGRTPRVPAPQFEQGETVPGLVAEHGFAALVTVRRGDATHTVLFDTGVSPNGLADNLERLDLDSAVIEARGVQPRPLRPRRRPSRARSAAPSARAADHAASTGVDETPDRVPGTAGLAVADAQPRRRSKLRASR